MACSHRRHGQGKTVLSCPRRRCEHNWRRDKTVVSCLHLCSHRRRGQNKTVLLRLQLCLQRWRGQDKTVLSCLCRRWEQAISCKLETGSRRDKIHRNWVDTRQNCLVGGVNTIGDKTRQDSFVSFASAVWTSHKNSTLLSTPLYSSNVRYLRSIHWAINC